MARKEYANVTLRRELLERVDALVKDKSLGFRSRADFVVAALRHFLPKMEEEQHVRQTRTMKDE